jgi:hypothetical protein
MRYANLAAKLGSGSVWIFGWLWSNEVSPQMLNIPGARDTRPRPPESFSFKRTHYPKFAVLDAVAPSLSTIGQRKI